MADRGADDSSRGGLSAGTIQIVVAVIGVTGVIATALFANWDKIVGNKASASRPVATIAAADPPAADAAAAKNAAQKLSDSQQAAFGAATGALDDVTRQIEGAGQKAASLPSVTGQWADADGYSFSVRQAGTTLTYQEYANGVLVGQGSGQIVGRDMHYGFQTSEDRGECRGQLSANGNSISGRCQSVDGNSWPFTVVRQD